MLLRTKSLHRQPAAPPRNQQQQQQQRASWRVGQWLSSPSPPMAPPSLRSRRQLQQQQQQSTTSTSSRTRSSVSPPLRERQLFQWHKQTPAMTLVLTKLKELLPQYCQAMAEGQFVHCCSLLGAVLTTTTTGTKTTTPSSSSYSPTTGSRSGGATPRTTAASAAAPPSTTSSLFSVGTPPLLSRLSPTTTATNSTGRSPIRNWLLTRSKRGGAGEEHDARNIYEEEAAAASYRMVLESKMEVLFLLVGAESMYANMAHASSSCSILSSSSHQLGGGDRDRPSVMLLVLINVYEQTIKDLHLLRLTLCDTFLTSNNNNDHKAQTEGQEEPTAAATASSSSGEMSMATLAACLLFLVYFCQARIQCIHLQSALWHCPTTNNTGNTDPSSDPLDNNEKNKTSTVVPSPTPNFAEIAVLFESIRPKLMAASSSPPPQQGTESTAKVSSSSSLILPIQSLASAILHEIGAWSGLCQTAFAVQNCRFAESILGAQITKVQLLQLQTNKTRRTTSNINIYKPSCLELWLRDTLKAVIGTFPIVFDKVSAFAKPLYGFDEDMDVPAASASASGGGGEDSSPLVSAAASSASFAFRSNATADAFEMEVVEALHKLEKNGAVSVAVVVDAMMTGNARVESGFCPTTTTTTSNMETATTTASSHLGDPIGGEAATRQQFPAVYMRTLSSAAAVAAPSSPGSPRTVSSPLQSPPVLSASKDTTTISSSSSSAGGLLLVGRGMRRDTSRKDRLKRAGSLPYDDASTSSPRLLAGKSWSEDPSSGSNGNTAQAKKNKAMNTLQYGSESGNWPHSEWTALAGVLTDDNNDSSSIEGSSRLFRVHQTVYCVEKLSDSVWLVAMIKSLEHPASGSWHWQSRPTRRPTMETLEDDLHDLVSNLASMVRISDRFHAASVQLFRENVLERSSSDDDEIGAGLAEELKDRGFMIGAGVIGEEGVFRLIKNQLKVLAEMNNSSGDATSGYSSQLPTRSRLLRRGRRGDRKAGETESAAAFFLGRDLMHTID